MADSGFDFGLFGLILLVVLGAIVCLGVWRKWRDSHLTFYDYEQVLKLRNGVVEGVVGPGRYAKWPGDVEFVRFDMRSQSATVASQEILTADNLSVRVSINVVHRISDPIAYRRGAQFPEQRLYEVAQAALRRQVSAHSLDAILADRSLIETGLKDAIATELGDIGLIVEAASLRDLTLAGPAKQALADLWKAEKEGQAALTRARGEQAALRSLANAARLLKGNPELMNLRILQAVSGKPGAPAPTIVLGAASGLLPVGQASDTPEPDNIADGA
jgi:regulator of protease activity HflC (stomatin/prohibitin superfamily)